MITSLVMTLLMQESSSAVFEIVKIVIAALSSGVVGTLAGAFVMRKKVSAETNKLDVDAVQVLTNTSLAMLKPMEDQVIYLTKRLNVANNEIAELSSKVSEMSQKIQYYQTILKADIIEINEDNIDQA